MSQRSLIVLVIGALALPILICVLLGVGRLLGAMEDAAGAAVVGRIALAVGVVWLIDLVLLVIAGAINTLLGTGRRD